MNQMYFGNFYHAQWVPCPATGMQRSYVGFSNEMQFVNGGASVTRSAASHSVYDMQFPVADASEYEGIEAFQEFANGSYMQGPFLFVDPMIYDQNVFPPNWAAPGLAEQGWKTIAPTTPTFSDTGANTYGRPIRKATYPVTIDAGEFVQAAIIIIPPTHTLFIGANGSRTGTAVLRVQPVVRATGAWSTPVDATLFSDGSAPTSSVTLSGATYSFAIVYITRTTTTTSTITLTDMWGQLLPNGAAAPHPTRWVPGKGVAGVEIAGDGRAETYVMADRHLVGASIRLVEVF